MVWSFHWKCPEAPPRVAVPPSGARHNLARAPRKMAESTEVNKNDVGSENHKLIKKYKGDWHFNFVRTFGELKSRFHRDNQQMQALITLQYRPFFFFFVLCNVSIGLMRGL